VSFRNHNFIKVQCQKEIGQQYLSEYVNKNPLISQNKFPQNNKNEKNHTTLYGKHVNTVYHSNIIKLIMFL
jgi:hypothetical protein